MINSLLAELKKILTIRSTYVITFLAFAFVILINFFTAYKGTGFDTGLAFDTRSYIQAVYVSANLTGAFIAIWAILLMAHEYRYNLIIYTLTAARSRSRVLLSKLAITTLVAIPLAILICLAGLLAFKVGIHFHHLSLPSQELNIPYHFGRAMFYIWGMGLVGLLFATLIRNLVGSIATLFIVPGAVESLIGLLLGNKNQYLPFTSLKQVVVDQGQVPANIHFIQTDHALRSGLTFLIYLIVGWAIGWYLFLKRDAL